jgi:hypothetical protein
MKRVFLLIISFLSITIYAGNETASSKINSINKNFFIENKGQWPSEVKYLAKVGGMNAWITNSGVVYDYYQVKRNYTQQQLEKLTPDKKTKFEQDNTSINGHVVKMQLVSANGNAVSTPDNRQEGYYNYFLGNDETKWASNVPLYGNVAINEIYPKIDVKYYFDGKNIRYDYIVKPGADISKLKMKFEGQESVRINESGELVIKTSLGEVTNGKLYSYQNDKGKEKEVTCTFKQDTDGSINLSVKDYDKTKDLIIDPLIYSTFIGGSYDDGASAIAVDAQGNAYITGNTNSSNYPTTPGAYRSGSIGREVLVSKINQTGSTLIYSAFIGGRSDDYGQTIVIDANGNTYITGITDSPDFPTTPGAYTTASSYSYRVFVTKLNTTGNALVYSALIGEAMDPSIALDKNCNAYITGFLAKTNFPTTPGAYKTTGSGIFITKLNPAGSELVYSTFIDENGQSYSYSIATDAYGNAYITGQSFFSGYPTTPGAYKTAGSGIFITKLNPAGSELVYSTLIGEGKSNSIAIDTNGNAYITGNTYYSANYPTTPGAFQTTFSYRDFYSSDVFVTKLNPSGSNLVYSTFIGGRSADYGNSIAIDNNGNAYIAGNTYSSNFPITPGAYQTNFAGDEDAFVAKLSSTGSALVYSTFIGGSNFDYGNSIAIDANGNAYIAGNTYSLNFPITPGAFQTIHGGSDENQCDVFITKLSIPFLPYLQLKSPNGGEGWAVDSTYKITWRSNSNTLSLYKIEYSTDNGGTWMTIVNSVPSLPYEYLWKIPNTLSSHCKVRITALDSSGLVDISDSSFAISLIESINENNLVPLSNSLSQNFPNPFNPQTTISYSVAKESNVVIRVYDILGKEVAKLLNEDKKAGTYTIQFNASKLSSGMYFYTIQTNSADGKQSFRATKKMLLLK